MKKTEEKVIKLIRDFDLISRGDSILAALSGGPDSVFLLHFLHKFRNKYKITIGAIHINHMLRGKNALLDEEFCRTLCGDLQIPFFTKRKNVKQFARKNKVSVEEAGRILRYEEFEKTADRGNYSRIATAHNSGDNTETILLNLVKGTGIKGLSGIPVKRGRIIRPILNVQKSEILAYLKKNNLPFRSDESNDSDVYERNFIRNKIIPGLKLLNPSMEDTFFNNSSLMRSFYDLVVKHVEELINRFTAAKGRILEISDEIFTYDHFIRTEFLKTVVERNFSVQLSFKDVNELEKTGSRNRGSSISLLTGITVSKEKGKILLFRSNDKGFIPRKLRVNEHLEIDGMELSVTETGKGNFSTRQPWEEYIAADDMDDEFIVRQWQEGDRFFPLGMKGSKKVSDLLNERKIETYLKKQRLVLTNRDRIVWVIGLRIDNRFRITANTKKVLKLCLK